MDDKIINAKPWLLNQWAKNVYSQNGEDGILEKILEKLPAQDKWCAEFGAWDGKHLSNTFHLIETHDYRAVLIEGDEEKFKDLLNTQNEFPKIIPVCKYVDFNESRLDEIFSETDLPKDFDILSIDIDGNDYHVWEMLKNYQPKVVIIEYNPTMDNSIKYIQPKDMNVSNGNSIASTIELGKEKGYELVAVTKTNAIFVDKKYFPAFEIPDNSVNNVRIDYGKVTHLFYTYDGTFHVSGRTNMTWHGGLKIKKYNIQQLPWFFRQNPLRRNQFQKIMYSAYLVYRNLNIFEILEKICLKIFRIKS